MSIPIVVTVPPTYEERLWDLTNKKPNTCRNCPPFSHKCVQTWDSLSPGWQTEFIQVVFPWPRPPQGKQYYRMSVTHNDLQYWQNICEIATTDCKNISKTCGEDVSCQDIADQGGAVICTDANNNVDTLPDSDTDTSTEPNLRKALGWKPKTINDWKAIVTEKYGQMWPGSGYPYKCGWTQIIPVETGAKLTTEKNITTTCTNQFTGITKTTSTHSTHTSRDYKHRATNSLNGFVAPGYTDKVYSTITCACGFHWDGPGATTKHPVYRFCYNAVGSTGRRARIDESLRKGWSAQVMTCNGGEKCVQSISISWFIEDSVTINFSNHQGCPEVDDNLREATQADYDRARQECLGTCGIPQDPNFKVDHVGFANDFRVVTPQQTLGIRD